MECKLVVGWRAYLAQATLVTIVCISLAVKRKIEWPRRPVLVWVLDVSKQGLSSCSCHASNLLFALLASRGRSQASECSWYFVQYNVDNLIGVSMTILAHHIFIAIAKLVSTGNENPDDWRIVDSISRCGEYGDPPSLARWGVQAAEWIAAVATGRCISGMTTVLFRGILWYPLAEGLDTIFTGRPVELVFFVLVVYPLFCGLLVSWIQDGVLKIRNHHPSQAESSEPLLEPLDESCPQGSIHVENEPDNQGKCLVGLDQIAAEACSVQDIDSAYDASGQDPNQHQKVFCSTVQDIP